MLPRLESTIVETGTPNCFAIFRQLWPDSLSRTTSSRRKTRFGLPNFLPLALAARTPLTVRSRIISRSNSANAPKMCSMNRDIGLESSVSMFWVTAMNRTPIQDTPLLLCIRNGVEQGIFIYREGNQVWGQGDPSPAIYINDNCFIHTLKDAEQKKLWPRVDPLVVRFYPQPEQISKGGQAELVALISGGLPPYNVLCSEPTLSADRTTQTELRAKVRPQTSASYQIEVQDSRGTRQTATAQIMVEQNGKIEPPQPPEPIKPPLPPPPSTLKAEGPLMQALTDLWAKARQAKCEAISKLTIEMTEAVSAWKVRQSTATLQGVAVKCGLRAEITAEGVDSFKVEFDGRVDKANPIKSFLEPNLRAADDVIFEARYAITFRSAWQA